jgi:hypothetical protein
MTYCSLRRLFEGSAFGTIITLGSGGVMMSRWGWESIFYFHGALTTLWFVFWMLFVSDTPSDHRLISEKEKAFILAALSQEKKQDKVRVCSWKVL